MSSLHISDLSIKGFRGISDLSVSGLGRVTLITGRNNTWKSSILEALRLYANNASRASVIDILVSREEFKRWKDEDGPPSESESVLLMSQLFHGFPQSPDMFEEIEISAKGKVGINKLAMAVKWALEEPDAGRRTRPVLSEPLPDEESGRVVVLLVDVDGRGREHSLDRFLLRAWPARGLTFLTRSAGMGSNARMPCMFVGPSGGERTMELGSLWDEIALTDDEQDVVDALQIVDPDISAVSMVESGPYSSGRRAVVRANSFPRPVPLRTFGDGANRVFALALALVNARGGLLLIDEFENGLHHTIQADVWRMIFRLAEQLDVQVFATTHSRDAVRAFQKAAEESPEEGALLRLSRVGDDIVSTVASEGELAIATRHDIELR